jgi:carbamoyl-phosphate synthase small subunit
LLALAAGANTFKLKYGHRSQNQPVIDVNTKRCLVTSQNHGFAVDNKTLPEGWKPWFVNLNDETNEGIIHSSGRFRSVQFHPEATPGPVDAAYLSDDFLTVVKR